MIQPTPASRAIQQERRAAVRLSDNLTARFACWLMPQSWRQSETTRRLECCYMPSVLPLLQKDRHDAIAVAQPSASIVVQGDAAFANLFSGNALLLRPVAEFLIAAFAIDKVNINGAFIGEKGGESGISALAIRFAYEQREPTA
jgi:hypothetical protein